MHQPVSVMIVEDDPDVAAVTELALQRVGRLHTSVQPDAYAALAALEQSQPDILLMDVMMPGLTGVDALPQIRQTAGGRNVLVVFMTANTSPKLHEECMQQGAAAIITKPFDMLQLPNMLVAIWQQHRAAQQSGASAADGNDA